MAKSKFRVCVVDDDATLRKSLQQAAKTAGYDFVAFGSVPQFLSGFDPTGVFCIVLEMRLPGMSGLELQEVLRAQKTHIPLIFLTGHADIRMAVQAVKNGALDVLEKPFKPEILKEQLQKAKALYAAWQKLEQERREIASRIEQLTRRELEVLNLMVQGLKNPEIAKRLGISRKTLDIHRTNVVEKMKGPATWSDLVRWHFLIASDPGGAVVIKPGGYVS